MVFKFVVFAAFVAVAKAGAISYSLPAGHVSYAAPAAHVAYGAAPAYAHAPAIGYKVAAPIAKAVVADDYDPNPQYSYSYDIQDALTGDSKNQQETRNGDHVSGSYSLVESDGTRRIVEYTADPHNGFNAVVHKEPLNVAVKAAPLAYAAPVAKYAAPLAYSAPVAKYAAAPIAHALPVAKYYH